jgi:hippurate hydrolase
MRVIHEIEARRGELEAIRRDIHAHPELAFEEQRTAEIVARSLAQWGIAIDRGLARTGVVGTLVNGDGPTIGLRADMDALPIREATGLPYSSQHEGKMHACGHDGHTTMLLAAAQHLAETRRFRGTIHFIFQPAEEAAGGAKVMVDEGLFSRFPVDAVFGMHNWPGLAAGRFAVRTGAMMASLDCFDIVIEGVGTHGALPHRGVDPVIAAAHVITALQSVVSRNVDPLQAGVVSVTRVHGGEAYNIIPDCVTLAGGIRCFDPELRVVLRERVETITKGVVEALGSRARVSFALGNPAVINDPSSTAIAVGVAEGIVGSGNVDADAEPSLGSEDFAFMLEKISGCYIFIGNGDKKGGCVIHNPGYDFNDDILTLGATYWVRLAERFLG